jgi:tetratricopeptide (TPR) repeat protein
MKHDPETSPTGQAVVKPTRLEMPRTRVSCLARGWLHCAALMVLFTGQSAEAGNATILEIKNKVETALSKTADWKAATVGQSLSVGDRIRTRQRSLATIALTGLYTVRMDQFTTVEITPALVTSEEPRLDLTGGAAFIFSREPAGKMDVRLPAANAALRGTQLYVRVLPDGTSQIQVLEGVVNLENPQGRLTLNAGESGEAIKGRAPRKTAVIEARNLLQWALYYPAVIDPAEFRLEDSKALDAYQKGNLLAAVATLPAGPPAAADERVFHAGILLAVGRVDEAHASLGGVPAGHPGKRAILRMIQAVRGEPADARDIDHMTSASEALAESYFLQSLTRLEAATAAARRATVLSPENGFAWTRLAELEFSAGHSQQALAAIGKGLEFTPENARVHALTGFILSARNRIAEARAAFERSVALDGGFGNGWLGLGLIKTRQGDLDGGRLDLQTAATVEPTSSIFHSYLGKAMSQDGRRLEAEKDLTLARQLDPLDPTPLLYMAIEKQRSNRTNEAIGDLEESIRLNDNRRVYRSEFLLDQDRAVRNANLARIYQAAGMKDLAVREATRAVENDYTNPSAHLFLANSYNALRDPDRTLLRYETPWFNELLLANLLSPVGGGQLSQVVSQQEYSKLLEADGIGGSLLTEWRSTSELRTTASVFGTHGNVSYGIDAYYRNDDGDRTNSDIDLREIYGQLKWQPTADDIVYFLGKWSDQSNGDLFESYDNRPRSTGFRFDETQEPGLLLAGWNHQWRPGSNTLLLLGRLAASQRLADPFSSQGLAFRGTNEMRPDFISTGANGRDRFTDPALAGSVVRNPDRSLTYSPELLQAIQPYLGSGDLLELQNRPFDFLTQREWEIYGAEVQHIEQRDCHTFLLGGRWQEGTIETRTRLKYMGPAFVGGFESPAADQDVETDYQRTGLYAYDYWQVLPSLTLVGGIAWDRIDHPENFRNPPVSTQQVEDDQVSGKLGFTWRHSEWFTLRGAAAQGLGGLSFDESVRLEPTQVAGFNQAFRTVLSESIAGSVETPEFGILGLAMEGQLPTRTWWGVSAGVIEQKVSRTLGIFTGYNSAVFLNPPAFFPDGTSQQLDYLEQSAGVTLNQLLGDQFAIGASWRVTRSELETSHPQLRPLLPDLTDTATLHEISLFADWNSPSGWFAHVEANGFHQDLNRQDTYERLRSISNSNANPADDLSPRSGDSFIQFNAWAGYRFNNNMCELALGVLNIGGTDYQLSPLNPRAEIARDRTFFATCRLSF